MQKETLKALKGSIKKWEDVIAGRIADKGPRNCALCQLFIARGCKDCPIAERTGHKYCYDTPHESWCTHHDADHSNLSDAYAIKGCADCAELANEELEFLKALLPKTKKRRNK